MKLWLVILHIICVGCSVWATNYQNVHDNEFAEFEDFDSDEEIISNNKNTPESSQPPPHANKQEYPSDIFISDNEDDQEMVIEDDSEFEHFQDAEEFEGYGDAKEDAKSTETEPKITITKVPIHFRANWDSYWLEIIMIMGLVVYFLNFLTGKSKNTKIAHAWFEAHRSLLESNFTLVGDDGQLERQENSSALIKESENTFTLWCSGRSCCEGMLVELRLLKRQDLVAVIAGMIRPANADQLMIRVNMGVEDMAPMVLYCGNKKSAAHAAKNMADLGVFCGERKPGDRFGLPVGFQVMSENSETAAAIFDGRVTATFTRHGNLIDYIHISDQYSGVRQSQEDNSSSTTAGGAPKPPDVQRVILFGLQLPSKPGASDNAINEAVSSTKPLLQLVMYIVDRVKHYSPSREALAKAAKNRQRVEEAFLKSTHAARAEAAAARREERRRVEKERVLAEEDPEKQRRWEDRENKRQAKKRAPKMKQLKVKAL